MICTATAVAIHLKASTLFLCHSAEVRLLAMAVRLISDAVIQLGMLVIAKYFSHP
jgi:hypothetical protein